MVYAALNSNLIVINSLVPQKQNLIRLRIKLSDVHTFQVLCVLMTCALWQHHQSPFEIGSSSANICTMTCAAAQQPRWYDNRNFFGMIFCLLGGKCEMMLVTMEFNSTGWQARVKLDRYTWLWCCWLRNTKWIKIWNCNFSVVSSTTRCFNDKYYSHFLSTDNSNSNLSCVKFGWKFES